MTKTERRKLQLERHYKFLEDFSEFIGKKQDGKKLSVKLLALERKAHKGAENYCNGVGGMQEEKSWERFTAHIRLDVERLFGGPVPGFFVNGDARGYALKIDDEMVRKHYPSDIGFCRDMGGYGILSPEIE